MSVFMFTGRAKQFVSALVLSVAVLRVGVAAESRTPTQDGIVYGVADGQQLTMDYYAPKGQGPHPIAIIIHGGGYHGGDSKSGSEAYVADFLAPAGYVVFSVNYRLAPKYPYPYMVLDVQRAVRFIRHNAAKWDGDPDKIALVGGSAGGFLSNMVGLLNAPGDPAAADPVDREKAIREASPITYVNKHDPPFLEILGDQDEYIPFSEATNLQSSLHEVGVRCDIIRIPGGKHGTGGWNKLPGVPDWEREMTEWLNARLQHSGPVGEGIRPRISPPTP